MGKQWNSGWLYFGGLQNHYRWWLQPWHEQTFTLWKESYDQPRQHIQKQRHYFATKVHLVKAMVFPVVMYGCENWTVKKAERWRTDAFELWCWRRLLRVPWTARRSNQSIRRKSVLGVHWKDWCWSWNPNSLATWCEELTHWKRLWCWEGLGAGGEGTTEDEMAGWHHWLDGHEFEWTLGVGDGRGDLACCDSWGCKESDMTEWLNWTEW